MLFLTLKIFSATGGIEKVNRIAGKALYEINEASGKKDFKLYSMYDSNEDNVANKYFNNSAFEGFNENTARFIYKSVRTGIKADVVVLSHINLLIVGFCIKIFSPKTKLILIAHGIEVWKSFPTWKKFMLKKCDLILPVSKFTKDTMTTLNTFPENQFKVLNNCLDPFLSAPLTADKDERLLSKYELTKDNIILMTLTRLSANEKYKGHDNVLHALKKMIVTDPSIRYLLVGKYDASEKKRLDKLITDLDLNKYVVFAGFVLDEEIAAHYNLADIYIMPSKKEGFGIVFIEALYYGKPVIAGNKDGSVDALCNGQLGLLIDPDNEADIINAVDKVIKNKAAYIPDQNLLMKKFSYESYKNNLKEILDSLKN
jgi:glycosyltransferase involved in cell wall biosynthesis